MASHDDRFHCFDKAGSRTDTWSGAPIDFYSLTADLADLAKRSGGFAKVSSLGKTPGAFGGRELWILKLKGAASGKVPKVLLAGGQHAREWISPSITYLIAEWLVDNRPASGAGATAAQKAAQGIAGGFEVHFVPMVNPDGHEYSVKIDRDWRKNSPAGDTSFSSTPALSKDLGKQKGAPESVDLNRNYASAFRAAVLATPKPLAFSLDPDADTFAGTATAFETKTMQDLMKAEKYDAVFDLHSCSCSLIQARSDSTTGTPPATATAAPFMLKELNDAAASNPTTRPATPDTYATMIAANYYPLIHPGIYPPGAALMPGGLMDFAVDQGAQMSFAIELPPMYYKGTPQFNPPAGAIRPAFRSVLPAMLGFIANCKKGTAATQADYDVFKGLP